MTTVAEEFTFAIANESRPSLQRARLKENITWLEGRIKHCYTIIDMLDKTFVPGFEGDDFDERAKKDKLTEIAKYKEWIRLSKEKLEEIG